MNERLLNKMAARIIHAVCENRFPMEADYWKLFFSLLAREAGVEEDPRFRELMRMVPAGADEDACMNLLEQLLESVEETKSEEE